YAWHLLSDQTRVDASRLGSLFCTLPDLAQPQRIGLNSSSDIGEFLAARSLRIYALRETLRNRLLQVIVPYYAEYTQAANRAGGTGDVGDQRDDVSETYTYTTFSALLQRLSS